MKPFARRYFWYVLLGVIWPIFLAWGQSTPSATAMPTSPPGPVKIEAYVDKALATPKETITYDVIFYYPADLNAALPEFFGQIGGMRILDFAEEPPKADERHPQQMIAKRRLQLKADLTGTYILPAIHWDYTYQGQNYTAHSGEIFLEISAEGTGANPDAALSTSLKDIKPLRLGQAPWRFYLGGIWALWLMLMVAIWMLDFRKKKSVLSANLSPSVVVKTELANLRPLLEAKAWPPDAMKKVAFTISATLRNFIDAEFNYQSSEATWRQLQKLQGDLAPQDWANLLKILAPLEEVKFANKFWPQQEAQNYWQQADTWADGQIAVIEQRKRATQAAAEGKKAPSTEKDDDFL